MAALFLHIFMSKLYDYVDTNAVSAKGSVTIGTGSVQITGLDNGYYLVYGTALDGSTQITAALALTTANPDQTIILKADAPTLTKQTSDNASGPFASAADAMIGETVYFRLTSAVPNTAGYNAYTYSPTPSETPKPSPFAAIFGSMDMASASAARVSRP